MGSSKRQKLGREVWGLATAQHGVVARRQRGVYAVGRPELSRNGRWMAAVLGCGSGAALSYGSAVAFWGIERERRGAIEVSVPVSTLRRHGQVLVYRRPNLRSTEVAVRNGIPVTSLVRTLVDIAPQLDREDLERAVNDADRLGLIDPEALLDALTLLPGKRGRRATARAAERPRLPPDRLGAGAAVPAPGVRGRLTDSAHPAAPQRLQGRFRLARSEARRRDRRTALSPHRGSTDEGPPARPGASRRGLHAPSLHHAQIRFEAGYVRFTVVAVVNRLRRLAAALDA